MKELGDAGGGGFDVFRHVDGGEFGTCAGAVVEGLPVEDVAEIAALLILAFLLVEALLGLVAEPFAFEEDFDEGGEGDFGAFVADGGGLGGEVFCYVGEDVDADHVAEAEGSGFRPAEGGAGEGVDLFNGEVLRHHEADGVAHGEGADAVGDEVWGVVGVDDGLAEALIAKMFDRGEIGGVGLGGGNDFEQAHVARGIEEVGAEPVVANLIWHAFDDLVDGEAGGVAGDDGAGAAVLEDFGEEGALDVEVFGDDFDDPVAVGDEGKVVVEVAEGEEAGVFGDEEGSGFRLFEPVESGEDELVAF